MRRVDPQKIGIAICRKNRAGIFQAHRVVFSSGLFADAPALVTADLVLRLFSNPSQDESAISLEEIELVVRQGASDGVILPFEERLIYRVFDYADKRVSDVMTPRMGVISLNVEISMLEALEKAKLSGFSRFPVLEQQINGVIGYVHIKDLIWEIDKGINLWQSLREIVAIPSSVTLSEAFSILTKKQETPGYRFG